MKNGKSHEHVDDDWYHYFRKPPNIDPVNIYQITIERTAVELYQQTHHMGLQRLLHSTRTPNPRLFNRSSSSTGCGDCGDCGELDLAVETHLSCSHSKVQ